VDLLGHQLLGRKNLFYLMDALWATDYELDVPLKWRMAPFGDDWMSSIFASFDPIAIESVGFDFLRTEFTAERGAGTYPQMDGTDDYLHQAADSLTWPAGVEYDPEQDGTVLSSLGTHEHWNDGLSKQYSRNLGTGDGIELTRIDQPVSVDERLHRVPQQCVLYQNFPNPCNPTTDIRFALAHPAHVTLSVYSISGGFVCTLVDRTMEPGTFTVTWDGRNARSVPVSTGLYLYRMKAGQWTGARKMALVK
jgi:hypothetical protein